MDQQQQQSSSNFSEEEQRKKDDLAKKEKFKGVKKRNWAFIAYPESLPSDWVEQIQQSGLLCAISPLHDRDINPNGEVKKAHYHVILCYSGPTSFDVVAKFTHDQLHSSMPQALEQVRGYYRYLTHKDNPEKFQYEDHDIQCINGFNIRDFVQLTASEKDALRAQIRAFADKNDITEYSDLLDQLANDDAYADMYHTAMSSSMYINNYITSRRHRRKAEEQAPTVANLISRLSPEDVAENVALILQKIKDSKQAMEAMEVAKVQAQQ